MIKTFKDFWNSTFFTSCLLCLSLGINYAALAEYKKPPQNDAPQAENSTITATRTAGSCKEANTNFTALAPYGHIGRSSSTHPTFAWYIGDADTYPVQFRLYEYDATKRRGRGKTVAKKTLSSTPGIMTYTLPSDFPELTVGKKYVWQVFLVCNPNSPSRSLVVGTQIDIVEKTPKIIAQLEQTSDRITRADIYAEAGLWYDALAEVVDRPEPQTRAFIARAIAQLTAIEKQDLADFGNDNSEYLEVQRQHQQQLAEITVALTKK
jgi:hypothetical protein